MPTSPMAQSVTMAGTKLMQTSSVETMYKMFLEYSRAMSVSDDP